MKLGYGLGWVWVNLYTTKPTKRNLHDWTNLTNSERISPNKIYFVHFQFGLLCFTLCTRTSHVHCSSLKEKICSGTVISSAMRTRTLQNVKNLSKMRFNYILIYYSILNKEIEHKKKHWKITRCLWRYICTELHSRQRQKFRCSPKSLECMYIWNLGGPTTNVRPATMINGFSPSINQD